MRKLLILGIALSTLGLIAPAYGDAVFEEGDHHVPGEQNVLFHLGGVMGKTITGKTNFSHTVVDFTSTIDTLTSSGGQSDIDAVGGLIHDITITIPGHTFLDAVINPFKPAADGGLTVTVDTNTGDFVHTYGDSTGDNFLTITAAAGEVIDSVTIDSTLGFQGLKQPRVSAISGVPPVPEPSSILLLGSGLSLLVILIQKKGRLVRFET